jgi:aminopeptidase N
VSRQQQAATVDGASLSSLVFRQSLPETAAGSPRDPLPVPVRVGFVGQDGAPVATRLSGDNTARDEHVLLFDQAEASFAFTAADGSALPDTLTPSILRGFSAPVELDDDLGADERLRLMAHDSDMFNRWDSAQILSRDAILAVAAGGGADVDDLAWGYRQILADRNVLDDFKAGSLRLPGLPVLEAARHPADPVALFNARRTIQGALGTALADEIANALDDQAGLAATAGGRALLVQFVELGVAAGNATAIAAAETMVADTNMTMSQGGLKALIHCDDGACARGLAVFHGRWQDNPLVMEKWFQMESMSSVGGGIARLDALMAHPGFDPKNPNKIRAILGAFMVGNTPHFHAADGSGYDYVARQLVSIDERNPQVAARMALPLTRMDSYSDDRKTNMREALKMVQARAQSNDLREVVDKAL